MLVIDYSRLPEPYYAILQPYVEAHKALLPVWVQYLIVSHNPGKAAGQDEVADCDAKEHYRQVQIRFTSAVFKQPMAIIEQTVIHELLHVSQSTYDRIVDEVLELLPKDRRKFYGRRLIEAREAMTEDQAWAIIHWRNAINDAD